MAQAVPRVRAPTSDLGRPAQALGSPARGPAGAVSVEGASSAVELALVMADAEWGVRRRTAGTDRRWPQGVPAQPSTGPRDDRAMHDPVAPKEHRVM
jgi:hypothetical protein